MSIQEIPVYIKTYPAYHLVDYKEKDKITFTGLRDSRAYKTLHILKYWEYRELERGSHSDTEN